MQHLPPHLFVTIVRFLGEPHQDIPESTNRHVFSQLFCISWCSRLLAGLYQYWYDWECDIVFHYLLRMTKKRKQRAGQKQVRQLDCQVLIERVFRACDADCDGYLNLQEMRPFASMFGFDRPQGAWAYEFRLLCVEHDRDPE